MLVVDPIFGHKSFVPSLIEVITDLRVSQKDLIDDGFDRAVAPNTISQVLSRKKGKNQQPPIPLAVDLIRALCNLQGLDHILPFLLSPMPNADPEAYDLIYKCVIAAYIDDLSSASIKKKYLDKYIFGKIKTASSEIFFTGSVPKRYLGSDFYQVLSEVIAKEPRAKVTFVVESPQHLFWRSFSLDTAQENESRPFEMMADKYKKIKSIMASEVTLLVNKITDKTSSPIGTDFSIWESDFPIHTDIIKIDDEIFFSPRTSIRQSESTVFRVVRPLNDSKSAKNVHLWNQMNDQIAFYKKNIEKGAFVGPLIDETEKISVYSGQGKYQRGSVRRSARRLFPEIETNVVHGLIFDRQGRLCLQFRESPESGENARLWDKSFGSIRRPGEASLEDTLHKSFQREIINGVTIKMSEAVNGAYARKAVNYRGQWQDDRNRGALWVNNSWDIFSYVDENKKSVWQFPKHTHFPKDDQSNREFVLFPNTFASVFILICDDEFSRLVDKNLSMDKDASSPICAWFDFKEPSLPPDDSTTRDLATYLDVDDKYGYGFFYQLKRISQRIAAEMKG